MLRVYNTLTRKLEEFKPIDPPSIGIYSCGPTVYWNQHLGNMYAYVQWDTMVRFLRYTGYQVKWVMNITDVGHMTSDEDTGEDKMEKGAKREGLTVWQIAEKYIDQFLNSLDLLNIQRPNVLCRATKHIQEQIELIKKIEANGFTYRTQTGLVFDTSKFPGYADFAKLNLEEQYAGSRVEVDQEKKKPWDFLLWITNQPTHVMQWDSPWGRGFPGWHIECTAMSTKYLGEQFDIHTGGKEHISVHHTNEIAQAYGAFGRQTANYWLHNEWLTMKDEKISKSLGNVFLVTDLLEKSFDPLSFRYLALTSHYRQGMNFTWEALKGARVAYNKLKDLILGWRENLGRQTVSPEDVKKADEFREEFRKRVGDDLNFPEGISLIWKVAKSNIPDPDKLDLVLEFDQIFGLKLGEASQVSKVPPEVERLIRVRDELRKQNKWEEADRVREELKGLGWEVEDTEAGPRPKKVK